MMLLLQVLLPLLLLLLLIEVRRDDGSTLPAIRVIYFNLCGQQSWSAAVCMLFNLLHTIPSPPPLFPCHPPLCYPAEAAPLHS